MVLLRRNVGQEILDFGLCPRFLRFTKWKWLLYKGWNTWNIIFPIFTTIYESLTSPRNRALEWSQIKLASWFIQIQFIFFFFKNVIENICQNFVILWIRRLEVLHNFLKNSLSFFSLYNGRLQKCFEDSSKVQRRKNWQVS